MSNNAKNGAFNLLKNGLNVQAGDSVLLVLEPTDILYDHAVSTIVRDCLEELHAHVTVLKPSIITDPTDFPNNVADEMERCDHTLFLSRVGDYVRFVPLPGSGSRVTCYALDADMLGAPYATVNNRLMLQLRNRLENELMHAGVWRIQCPKGTDLTGEFCWASLAGGHDDNLTVSLFPVATFNPVPCNRANGQVALTRWLMPGGATTLDRTTLALDGVVYAHIVDGMLDSFSGAAAEVAKVNAHYDHISTTLGINRNRVHSWHAGINPQTCFYKAADDYLDLWSAVSFGSPKYLHFHTCGDEPPGEVAWSVFNATVTIDGTVYWENGELVWLQRADNQSLIESYDAAHCLLEPSLPIGIS